MKVKQLLKEKAGLVEPVLREYVEVGPDLMQEMMSHPVYAGGKRVRPALALLAAESIGVDSLKILPAAASIELLHTFTLIHDDIMDDDLERRGKPTVHSKWGVGLGILVGDALYSQSFKALLDVRKNGFSEKQVLDSFETLVDANSKLQEGQVLDLIFEEDPQVSVGDYLDMVFKKTGVLIQASVSIGGILADASEKEFEALKIYGEKLGLAFQIKDDILDLTADEKLLGKPVGSDIRKGKLTLMVVHGLSNASSSGRGRMLEILGDDNASQVEVEEFISLLEKQGSIQYGLDEIKKYLVQAKQAVDVLPSNEGSKGLRLIADYVGERLF